MNTVQLRKGNWVKQIINGKMNTQAEETREIFACILQLLIVIKIRKSGNKGLLKTL